MQSGRTFFLVNSKSKPNLLDRNLILLFGTIEGFKNKMEHLYPNIIWQNDGKAVLKTEDGILDFYYGTEDVIEKFVMVDVKFTEAPLKVVTRICRKYDWFLYDLDLEEYVSLE
jgi:hypothetical protein